MSSKAFLQTPKKQAINFNGEQYFHIQTKNRKCICACEEIEKELRREGHLNGKVVTRRKYKRNIFRIRMLSFKKYKCLLDHVFAMKNNSCSDHVSTIVLSINWSRDSWEGY